MTDKGILFVFSGPSGTGKGTVLNEFNKLHSDYKITYSISATTRAPRNGEEDGKNYYFMSKNDFNDLVKKDGFLEWAQFCDNFYGTPKKPILDCIESGTDVILEIETNGAMQVKEKYPQAVLVFVLPPSLTELKSRLVNRGTETDDVVKKRLNAAIDEIKLADKYDYILVNDDINKAVSEFKSIIDAERLKSIINKKTIIEVLEK